MTGEIATCRILNFEYRIIDMKNFFQKFLRPRVDYKPLIEVRVFKNAILENLAEFKKHYPQINFAPVLKSNAYGHGLVEVANILDNQGAPFFMVDSFYEALVLRRAGIKTKVLVLGYVRQEQILNNKLNNVSVGIISLEQLKNISQNLKRKQNFHLKIDTGMHRQGVMLSEVGEAIKLIKANANIILEGVCSHFADADGETKIFTEKQIGEWNKIVEEFNKEFNSILFFHTSNTAGAYFAKSINQNVGRLGIGLYGFNQSAQEKLNLKPSLEMVSLISTVKQIQKGDKVGYGLTFEADKNIKIATVPVGYNEGVDRRLSSKGFYKIQNIFCPIVGRVSMNISSVDVTAINNIELEQEVIIFSSKQADLNSVENVAKICNCIPYEILVHIPQHLRRVII